MSMQAEINGKVIQLSEAGWLENLDEWSEELAVEIAKNEKIPELTQEHWDIINEAREYFQENGVVAEPRAFSKIMKKKFGPDSVEHNEKLSAEKEIRQLKKELKRVTEERDILKKAAVYFANQPD